MICLIPFDTVEEKKENLQQVIDFWLRILNIEYWRVDWKSRSKLSNPKAQMEITPHRLRQMATIAILDKVWGLDSLAFQTFLVHELTHLVFDPLVEEHAFVIKFETNELRRVELRERFIADVERAVENISRIIVKACNEKR